MEQTVKEKREKISEKIAKEKISEKIAKEKISEKIAEEKKKILGEKNSRLTEKRVEKTNLSVKPEKVEYFSQVIVRPSSVLKENMMKKNMVKSEKLMKEEPDTIDKLSAELVYSQ